MDASVQELLDLEWRLLDETPLAGLWPTQSENRKLFTMLFNAPATIENHYAAQVNHDLFNN